MKEVPVAHDLPKVPFPIERKLNDKQWVLKQFTPGVPEIAIVAGYKMRSTKVWEQLAVVERRPHNHPYLGVVDEWMMLTTIEPVRLWLKTVEPTVSYLDNSLIGGNDQPCDCPNTSSPL